MKNFRLFLSASAASLTLASAVVPTSAFAQETTSSIRGSVTSAGAPVPGATVRIVHVPSGTTNTVTTGEDGSFVANGLRVGGPFSVTVSAPNYADFSATDINTVVGQPYSLPVELNAGGEEIVVTASSIKGAGVVSQGPSTTLNAEEISNVASVNRDIRDLERRDPFATLDPTNSRAVSFAGQNPRFNRFSVDGVAISDNFGLNPDGLPSRRGPVPLDAIEQFQVKIAPFDIREGNFQGGAINVQLRSGTNEFQGTAFYTYSSDELNGDKVDGEKLSLPNFSSKDYGLELSGPIIKDKLFFMVAAERVRASNPITYGPSGSGAANEIPNLSADTIARVQQIAQDRYGYDTGALLTNDDDSDDRVVAKIDANITDDQRLSLTYTYTKDSLVVAQNSSTSTFSPSIGLASNGYIQGNRLHTGIAQLNSQWSDEFSTEIRGFYKDYKRIQDPVMGRGFAQFQICTAATSDRAETGAVAGAATTCPTGTPSVYFGPDVSRQSNALTSKSWGVSFLPRITTDSHDIKMLAEYQYAKIFNQFLQRSAGDFYFDSLADFEAGNAQRLRYQNAVTLNPNDAAARFHYTTFTAGVQDDWRVTDTLNVSYGLRYDLFGGDSRASLNPNFLDRYGYPNNAFIDGRDLLQPRVGFDWTPASRFSMRGGFGLFGGGAPDVYVSNSFSNTGILTSSVDIRQQGTGYIGAPTDVAMDALNGVTGTSIPGSVDQLLANASSVANASTNAMDPDFKVPSQWRATLTGTYDADLGFLGDHWMLGADFLYSKVHNQVAFVDIRSVRNGLTTPDGRPRYMAVTDPTDTNSDILLTNTSKGHGYIADVRFDKEWDFGLSIGGSYTYQDIKDQTPATSSTAFSNYQNGAFYDPNIPAYGTSNDETKHQFKYYVNFDHAFFGDYKTRIGLFGETRIGRPYSYTFFEEGSGRSSIFGTVGSASRYLFYVPTGMDDPLVSYDNQASAQAINDFIEASGLRKYRGQVAPRNAFNSPWFTKIDLHLEQEVPTFVGHSRISVFADIENVLNLLNSKWGMLKQFAFPYNREVASVTCLQAPAATGTSGTQVTNSNQQCVQYRYSAETPEEPQLYSNQSLYMIRLGVRFSF